MAAILLFSTSTPSAAAPAPRKFTIDPKGRLTIPADYLRSFRLKSVASGMVFLEFPVMPGWSPIPTKEKGREGQLPVTRPRIGVAVRPDGSVIVPPMRLAPYPFKAPGKPGSVVQLRRKEDRLVVAFVSGGYAKAPANVREGR